MSWKINKTSKHASKNPILIEGLPGVGNVGKIAVEYLIEATEAKKIYDITSNDMPNCVFVNDENLIELPKIEIYTTKVKGKTIFILSGDHQPTSENSCYSFCNEILDTFQKDNGKEIITLGGIALNEEPPDPQVYFTANSKKGLKKYSTNKKKLQNFIGPITGVTGILSGLAATRKIEGTTLLAETSGNPSHIGFKGAKKILEVLNKNLSLNIEITDLEPEITPTKEKGTKKINKKNKKQKQENNEIVEHEEEKNLNYIG
tara:strand:- start:1401 stop:2180 length:780 start_codon:yes stop_codon:yes gene_type:complete